MARERSSPEGGPAPAPPPGPEVSDAARARLHRVVTWFARLSGVVALGEVALGALLGLPALFAGALVAGALAVLLLAARARLRRGAVEAPIYAMALGLFAGAFAYTLALPGSVPSIALLPLLVVALALPYLGGPALVRLAAVAWAGGVVLVGLNLVLPAASGLPTSFTVGFRLVAFAGVLALGFLLLVHFSARLHETLRQTRAAHLEMGAAHARLQSLDRMKTQFLNTTAHELRTPLTPARVQLDLLGQGRLGGLNPRQAHALEVVDRNVARLQRLVEDVVDVAHLQAGQFLLHTRPLDPAALASEVAGTFRDEAEHRRVALEVVAGEGQSVEADPARLRIVLRNLLSNALKFTPPGGRIEVRVRAEEGRCVVAVQDTGQGIAPADVPKLFEPFSQVHDPMQQTLSGAGLGLFISRGIVEKHGGRIWCESPGPGQGATFAFTLPLAAPRAPAPELAPAQGHGAAPRPLDVRSSPRSAR